MTRLFTVPMNASGAQDIIWGLWSAGFGTEYGSQIVTAAVQVQGPPATSIPTSTPTVTSTPIMANTPTNTSIPTQPVLVSVAMAPTVVAPFGTLVLTYTVWSPSAQQVSLGAGVRVHGSTNGFTTDPFNDTTVSVAAGNNVVARAFTMPGQPNVTYDVVQAVWSPGFVTQYGSIESDSAVSVNNTSPPMCAYNVSQTTGATIVPGTTLVSRTQCNDCTGHIDIPFAFPLYDQMFTVAHSGVNGNLQFPSATGISNGCLPQAEFSYTIAPYFEDLDAEGPGEGVFTSISGAAPNRIFNIEWRAHSISNNLPVNFEVRLYEGQTRFDIIFAQVDNNGANASVGIQRDYSIYQSLSCQNANLTSGLMLTYQQDCSLATPVAATPTNTPQRTPSSTNTPTITNTPINTNTPVATNTPTITTTSTPAPPTATPTQPTLLSVAVSPLVASPGSSLVLSYTVFSPSAQQVSLGAGIQPSGACCWTYDGQNDRTLTISAGTSTVTRLFTVPMNASGAQDIIWGLWSAGFGTQYGSRIVSSAINVVGPTPTPSVPALVNVAVDSTAYRGGMVVLSYTVFLPVAQQVALGAGVAPSGTGQWVYDPAHDRVVNAIAGTSVITRSFNLGTLPAGPQDVRWGLWNNNFTTEYSEQLRSGVLTILAATATPTNTAAPSSPTPTATLGTPPTSTPTVTGTPPTATVTTQSTITPVAPTLLGVSLSTGSANTGGAVTLSYTIFSPAAGSFALGAQIRNARASFNDPGNDRMVTVPAGNSVVTRQFYIAPDYDPGVFDVIWGLWNVCFTTEYGTQQRVAALTVVQATVTPMPTQPTATPTIVSTPSGAAIALGATGPAAGLSVNIGSSFTVNYTIYNTTGSARSVRLGARLIPSGSDVYVPVDDTAHQVTINAPPGTSSFTRQFQVPASGSEGSYDLVWSLLDPSNNALLDTRTGRNQVWLSALGRDDTTGISLGGGTLTANTITLQNGIVNPISGNFTIVNSTSVTIRVVMRMRIKLHGGSNWVSDLAGERLVSVPAGSSTYSLNFAVPRYLPSGSYDVLWELGASDFNGAIDNSLVANALQITNPAIVTNVGVPILMYHNINPTSAGGNWVTVCNFTTQMDYLANNGWTTITGEDMYNYIYKGTALPAKPVWLTFDDSYENIYDYAYSIMQAHGQKASIFSVTQYMGLMNSWDLGTEAQHLHMTWNMLSTMSQAGQSADGHTQHHVALYDLTVPQQQAEIWGNQVDLVSRLGQPGLNFAYPYGQYPDSAKWLVAHSGFHAATVIGQAKQYTDYADMYELTRIGVYDSDSLSTFISKLNQP